MVARRDVLALPQRVVDELIAHARAVEPNEACGLVAGDLGRGRGTTFHPARNALGSPYRFDVHPEDLVRILDHIERAGLDLVAIFHSHPRSPAIPSALDRREARDPVPNLICGAGGDGPAVLRAWRIDGSDAVEIALRIEPDQQSEARLSSTRRSTGSRTRSMAHELSSLPDR